MTTDSSAATSRRTWKARWHATSAAFRRRIVLGTLFALALAARDVVLLFVAGGLFALSEAAPMRPALPRPSG